MSKPSAQRLGYYLAGLLCILPLAVSIASTAEPAGFSGGRAFEDLKRLVALGPRPSGSEALTEARQYILHQLRQTGVAAEEDRFVATTPAGSVSMVNVIGKIPGARRQVVIIAGHYETKRFADFSFVGANDGGSSAAFLLELARALAGRKNDFTYWLVFFDGEEAFREFTETDGLYGSRHLVEKLASYGELSRIEAMILVDMIGDAHLNIHREENSTQWLTELVFQTARRLGYEKYFRDDPRAYVDDHIPFVNAGVAATDLLDFDYGPNNRYWHTAQDTLDKCSPTSLTIVGRVVLATLGELERTRLK
jgi:Zn-dependent M28 family amino/carboxypeptidase